MKVTIICTNSDVTIHDMADDSVAELVGVGQTHRIERVESASRTLM